jgi:GGDEF domain-containing protein
VLVEHIEWLERLTHHPDVETAGRAARILHEAAPTLEDDVARHVLGADAWADTFLLWAFARRPRALTRVRGLMTAVASRYASRASRAHGLVLGRSFPFFDVPMPSATAHLASAAARVGDGVEVVAPAIEWLQSQRHPDGGWGDPGQPTDPLTTIAVAELLGILDPGFDPAGVLPALEGIVAAEDGVPRLMGPEWPWLAAELLAFAGWSRRPFRERFRWPHVPPWMIDERVRVPRYEAYLVNARLFETIPGLAPAPVEIAFLDLADFGVWNSKHGQAAGDELLAALTALLRTIPETRTIRDGGDEFLVLGAPHAVGLEGKLRDLSARWAQAAEAQRPDRPVVPLRAAVTTTRADRLRPTREELGQWIGCLKSDFDEAPPEGVVLRFPEYLEERAARA